MAADQIIFPYENQNLVNFVNKDGRCENTAANGDKIADHHRHFVKYSTQWFSIIFSEIIFGSKLQRF